MVMIDVGDLKMAREALCAAQRGLNSSGMSTALSIPQSLRLEKMIDQIDMLRPLGPDGKHGSLHTQYCGCDNVEHVATKITLKQNKKVLSNCNCFLRVDHEGKANWAWGM